MVCRLVDSLASPNRPTTSQNSALSSVHAFRQHGNIQSLYGIFVTVTMASTQWYQLQSRAEWAVPHLDIGAVSMAPATAELWVEKWSWEAATIDAGQTRRTRFKTG